MLSPAETETLCTICLNVGVEALELAIQASNNSLDWPTISKFDLPESFIRKYAEFVHWRTITHCNQLSSAFIEEHIDRVDWHEISLRYSLSDTFMRKWIDRLDTSIICHTQKLSLQFIYDFEERFDSDAWFFISLYQPIDIELIRKHREDMMMCERVSEVIKKEHAIRTLFLKKEIPVCVIQSIQEHL